MTTLTDRERDVLLEWARLLETDEFIQVRGVLRNQTGHCAVGVARRFLPNELRRIAGRSMALLQIQAWVACQNDGGRLSFAAIARALRDMASGSPPAEIVHVGAHADRCGDEPLCGAAV